MTRSGLRPARAARAAVLAWIVLVPATAGAQAMGAPAGTIAPAPDPIASEPAPPEAGLVGPPPQAPPVAPAPPAELPLAVPALERAWRDPAASLAARADRVRAAADALGITDVEPVARALLIAPELGGASERAAAAARVAPGLPAAQLARAGAAWRDGDTGAALAAARRALLALPRHLESLLWLEATGLALLGAALLAAGLLWIAARGGHAASHAAHDLADRLDPSLPGFARAGLVAALVLAPAALGEGLLGAAIALFALGWWHADTRQRRSLVAAAALVVLALGPLASAAGRALAALPADPVVLAATAAETGFLDPVAAARLEHAAAAGDPLAVQALARHARRAGDLGRAGLLLEPLLDGTDARVLNDAAHVRLLSGDARGAITLYRAAIERSPSADLWFNLAQAHVRAIEMDAHALALEAAQAEDAARTRELTQRLAAAEDVLVDLPFPVLALRARLRSAADPAAGTALRVWAAPGRIGATPWLVPIGFALAAGLAGALAARVRPSRACGDCGTRLCVRCGSGDPADGVCPDCARRRLEARHGGPWERGERAAGLAGLAHRVGAAAHLVLPGVTEPQPGRPGLALAALALLVVAAVLFVAGRGSVAPDPAAVGGSGPLALAAAASLALVTGVALASRSRRAGRR